MSPSAAASSASLSRPRHGRMIAGVCAGIARRFGWSTTVVRVVTVASLLLPGPQILAYLILWLLMPNDRD
ncbi:PspC domain-containing protein [Cellulosimicrobium sp. NPDC057127]|uniref:PspC domain-containing protein n=1 Tax=Cellulosimicrobium sp. NPDC057127 TaxID=3346026 RepID=UPI0036345C5E